MAKLLNWACPRGTWPARTIGQTPSAVPHYRQTPDISMSIVFTYFISADVQVRHRAASSDRTGMAGQRMQHHRPADRDSVEARAAQSAVRVTAVSGAAACRLGRPAHELPPGAPMSAKRSSPLMSSSDDTRSPAPSGGSTGGEVANGAAAVEPASIVVGCFCPPACGLYSRRRRGPSSHGVI